MPLNLHPALPLRPSHEQCAQFGECSHLYTQACQKQRHVSLVPKEFVFDFFEDAVIVGGIQRTQRKVTLSNSIPR